MHNGCSSPTVVVRVITVKVGFHGGDQLTSRFTSGLGKGPMVLVASTSNETKLVDGSAGNSWGFVGLLDQLLERWYVQVFELLDVET